MFKLAISLIALAAFNCACASPIPPTGTNVVTDKVAELSGSLTGLSTRQIGEIPTLDDLEDAGQLLELRQLDDNLSGDELTSLLDEIDTISRRQLSGLSLLGGLPIVGPIVGGATGGSSVGSGLLKRQLSGLSLLGGLPIVGPIVGGATGGSSVGSGLLKRQGDILGEVTELLGSLGSGGL